MAAGGGFLAGFSQGLGNYAQNQMHTLLDIQLQKAKGLSDIYSHIAQNPNFSPEVQREAYNRATQIQGLGPNEIMKGSKQFSNFNDLFNMDQQLKTGAATGSPTGMGPAGGPGTSPASTQPAPAQPQGTPAPASPAPGSSTAFHFGSPIAGLQPPDGLYTGGMVDPMKRMQVELYNKAWETYAQSAAQRQATQDFLSSLGGGGGNASLLTFGADPNSDLGKKLLQVNSLAVAMGKEPIRPQQSIIGGHPATFLEGEYFINGQKVDQNTAVKGGTPKLMFVDPHDGGGPRYMWITGDAEKAPVGAPLRKPAVTRSINTTVDVTGGKHGYTQTSYGGGGTMSSTAAAPVSGPPSSAPRSGSTPSSPPSGGVVPTGNAQFDQAVQDLINRKSSLSDYPKEWKGRLVAAMPTDVRAAEDKGDLQNLITADMLTDLIQQRISRLRSIVSPENNGGRSPLDDPTVRAEVAATLHPTPAPEKAGLYSQGSHWIGSLVQGAVRGQMSPVAKNYVNELRQLRDDILSLRGILKGSPMRSNAQMNIQLAQVPDESNISSYKDFEDVMRSYEVTPATIQNIQRGQKPSSPGTFHGGAPPPVTSTSTPSGPPKVITKFSPSTKLYYKSSDGGQTWQTSPTP